MTLLVRTTGLLAEMDFGSALATVRVYISENLGSFEDTINPVLLKDPCVQQKYNHINFQKLQNRSSEIPYQNKASYKLKYTREGSI